MKIIRRLFFVIFGIFLLAGIIPEANATSGMQASESCVDFIKTVEGFSAKPYFDYAQYTVGYGTECPADQYDAYMAGGISKSEAEALLREELNEIEDALNTRLIDKHSLSLTQHQFDALVSFSFNIGTNWLTYNSTLRHALLNPTSENDMVYAFSLYCTAGGKYLPGLVNRRLCEANMFLNGVYSQSTGNEFGYVYYDANGGTVTYRVQGFLSNSNAAPAEDAKRNNDVFLGWYTDLTGGTQVTTLSNKLNGKTLFARWQASENPDIQASGATTVTVTGDVVNVRNGPGTNYGVVNRVYRNTVLSVSHITHLTNMKWGKIQDGWICLDYTNYDAVAGGTADTAPETDITPPEETVPPADTPVQDEGSTDAGITPEQQKPMVGYVNVNDFLKIRTGPGTTYPSVGFLFRNTEVWITEQRTVGTTAWGRIEKGWICMDYIVTEPLNGNTVTESEDSIQQEPAPEQNVPDTTEKTQTPSVTGRITADALRIRSSAGTASSIVGFYYENDIVTVTEKILVGSVYWGKTNKGWISMDYVSADSAAEVPSQPENNETKTIIADCLRVRQDAGTNHKIVGFLYTGDKVTILETKTAQGALWGRVSQGWISMQYVK